MRVRICIETDMQDSDGNQYPHPRYWDWEDLVGGNTVFITAKEIADA